MAPEITGIEPSADYSRTPTTQTDLFTLGMVVIEVATSIFTDTWSSLKTVAHSGVHGTSAVSRKRGVYGDEEDRGRRTSTATSEDYETWAFGRTMGGDPILVGP